MTRQTTVRRCANCTFYREVNTGGPLVCKVVEMLMERPEQHHAKSPDDVCNLHKTAHEAKREKVMWDAKVERLMKVLSKFARDEDARLTARRRASI